MSTAIHQISARAAHREFSLGSLEGWGAVDVLRWRAEHELSRPFEYDIVARRDAALGPLDLDALLDTGVTFRVATELGWSVVHGIVGEAEELERTRLRFVYRIVLVPHVWRARFRISSRTWRHRSIQEIVSGGAIVTMAGGAYSVTAGGPMALGAGGDINASAPNIKLNG